MKGGRDTYKDETGMAGEGPKYYICLASRDSSTGFKKVEKIGMRRGIKMMIFVSRLGQDHMAKSSRWGRG